ncbi:hypothetical protein QOZ80_3BG0276190 [Eleusine coracana subsp. coracana]|nr:hypothetical protein QOZ80_3BG0276190 [Eleusine coracana subsp. coracana]
MGRKPCCPKEGLNRGAWTAMEDDILVSYIRKHGEGRWGTLPKRAGLKRCGKSCRLRWLNYLRPGIKRGNISDDEEELIIRLHRLLGNRWSLIAGRLPGRTDNEIKNYWNTTLGKKVRGDVVMSSSRSKQQHQPSAVSSIIIRSRPSASEPASDAAPDEAAVGRPSPEPNTSPVRTKALRCTARVPVAPRAAAPASNGGRPPDEAADERVHHAVEAAEDCLAEDDLSIDLDFDMGDLGFLSPWRGEGCGAAANGVVGPGGQFVGGEADMEALLMGTAGDDDVEFAWF